MMRVTSSRWQTLSPFQCTASLRTDSETTESPSLARGCPLPSFRFPGQKRSLTANAYAWALMNQLSAKLNKPVLEIYRETIRDIGGSSTIITIRADAAKRFKTNWEGKGDGWQCLKLDEMPTPQGAFYTLQCFYGSSVYDSAQMHRLIELIVQECQQHGIPTMTPEEIFKLKGLMKGSVWLS